MAILRPFRALRPSSKQAPQIAAVPYDVVNRDEAAAIAKDNVLSFLHVSRAEIDMSLDQDPYDHRVYEKAHQQFKKLMSEGHLIQESKPSLYIYRLRMGDHIQTGIGATFSIDEYDRGLIKKHERTRQDKEDDRTRHVITLGAQTGPVFLAYRGLEEINQRVTQVTSRDRPLYDFAASDQIQHTLWKIEDTSEWVELFKLVPTLYIADGHHRAASASRARREHSMKGLQSESSGFFLAVAFPAEQLRILPYNRVLKDLNGMDATTLLRKLNIDFEVVPLARGQQHEHLPPQRDTFALYLEKSWYKLIPKKMATSQSLADALDVSLLQREILAPYFGIQDPRTDKRIDFVGGIRGTDELERLVDTGKMAAAFALHPTSLEDLMKVSDAGEIMPPKSTWFEPKLRDGLLSHLY